MKITKAEILEIIKNNNLNKEQAEQFLELAGKGLGGSLIDLISLVVEKTPNTIDDMVWAASKGKIKEYVSNLEITL